MKTFKAAKNKSAYKNTDAWIDAVYRNNKQVIDAELSFGKKSGRTIFKQMIKEHMDEGLSPTKAVKTVARSTLFTSTKERITNNFYEGLKNDKDAYKNFREATKEKGRYTKFDPDKLVWDKKDKVYIYNNKVRISYDNSPVEITVATII